MANLLILFPALLQLLGKFILALRCCCHLTGILAVIHHILYSVDLGFIYALHLVQVVDTQIADGIRCVAVQIDQCLGDVIKVFFQRISTANRFQPVAQAGNDVIVPENQFPGLPGKFRIQAVYNLFQVQFCYIIVLFPVIGLYLLQENSAIASSFSGRTLFF